ncbi:MAG: hypothetical protein K6G80_08370 [Treponema sp.]|nr:hypothetical protein [Treponema sp.]
MKTVIRRNVMLGVMQNLFVAAVSLAFLAGCSEVAGGESESASAGYTVSGTVLVGGASGATALRTLLPENASLPRSASSSLTAGSQKTSFAVYAGNGDVDSVSGTVLDNGSFSIVLPSDGEWNLRAVMQIPADKTGESLTMLEGETAVVVKSGETVAPPVIIMYPLVKDGETGNVTLSIRDDTKKVDSVSCTAVYITDALLPEESAEKLNGELKFESCAVTISQSGVPAGTYEVTFFFNDESGNVLYKCMERISVFGRWTTDTWYGGSSHIQEESDGTSRFVITDDLISAYGTEVVPDTPYALYTESSEGYSYSLMDSPTASATSSFTTPKNSVVFDNEGNAYYLQGDSGSGYTIASTRSDFSYDAEAINYTDSGCGLMFDRANNVLYAYSINEATLTIFEYTSAISSGVIDSTSTVTYTSNIDMGSRTFSHSHCIVNNAIVYDLGYVYGNTGNYIAELDLSTAPSGGSVESSNIVSLALPSASCSITDMLYQDGAVYMLVRQVSTTGANSTDLAYYSRGSLLRYDVHFGTVQTVIPFSDSSKSSSDFASVKVGLYYQGNYQIFEDTGTTPLLASSTYSWTYGSTTYTVSDCIPALYTPNPLETDSETHEPVLSSTAFYGPVKFVAVKPRKLVIADDGLAFYTDADGVLKYKNVNRVVTVDLESFAITDATSSSASFAADDSSIKSFIAGSQSTMFQSAFSSLTNATRYYNEDGTWKEVDNASYMWACIPCGD